MEKQQSQLTKQERRELRHQEKDQKRLQTVKRKIMSKFLIWALVALGIGSMIFGLTKLEGSPSSDKITSPVDVVSVSDWTKGNKDAKIILIEYSDFQCPACATYYPILKQLNQEFGDKVLFVYRHFPLPNHKNAGLAARATESAGKQGKFWEMHDLIFDNQKIWSDKTNAEDDFVKYAESQGLDIEKFKSDIISQEIKNKVESDYKSGYKIGINATPTFFLNGKKIQNPRSYDEFKKLIQDTISNTQ